MSTPKKILVIDLEATCEEREPPNEIAPIARRNEIIEVGITPVNIKTREIEPSETIIVLPTTTEISDYCTNLTTLTPEFVKTNGVTFPSAIQYLKEKYRTDINVWASFGDYDREAFERQCHNEHVIYPFGKLHVNIKALYAMKMGESAGMKRAMSKLGVTFEGTRHRGIDDSRATAQILLALLKG